MLSLFFVVLLLLAVRGDIFDSQCLLGNEWEALYYDEPQLRILNAEGTISSSFGYPQSREHTQLRMIKGDTRALLCCGWSGSTRLSDTWFLHTDAASEAARWEKTGAYGEAVDSHRFVPCADPTISMISFGGINDGGTLLRDVYFFQTNTDTWTSSTAPVTADTPPALYHGCVWPLPPSMAPAEGFLTTTGFMGVRIGGGVIYRFATNPDRWLPAVAATGDIPDPLDRAVYWTDYETTTPKAWLYSGIGGPGGSAVVLGGVYALDVSMNGTETPYAWTLYSTPTSVQSNITGPSFTPGSRLGGAATEVNSNGDVLLFGGAGFYGGSSIGLLGDLWLFRSSESIVGTFDGWYPLPVTGLDFAASDSYGSNFNESYSALKPAQRLHHAVVFSNDFFYVFGGKRIPSVASELPVGGIIDNYDSLDCSGDLWSYRLANSNCSGHGHCQGYGLCQCEGGYYPALDCSSWNCSLLQECSNHGACIAPSTCMCEDGFYSYDCSDFNCSGLNNCSSHGSCIGPNQCFCSPGWDGDDVCGTQRASQVDNEAETLLPIEAIIGIASGSGAGLIVVIIMFCVICCCVIIIVIRKRHKVAALSQSEDENSRTKTLTRQIEIEEDKGVTVIAWNDIQVEECLGTGGSGAMVSRGIWMDFECAVKVFTADTGADSLKNFALSDFFVEVEVMCQFAHPNILQGYGISIDLPRIALVMEYCKNGDLKSFLLNRVVSFEDKVRLLSETCNGMAMLHAQAILHRDLKCQNVFVDENEKAKVADFGLSKVVERMSQTKTGGLGTSGYLAPEIVHGLDYDDRCDVFSFVGSPALAYRIYSFGIMIFQVLTGVWRPYGKVDYLDYKVANDPSYRPQLDKIRGGSLFRRLASAAWSASPDDRPSFQSMRDEFEEWKERQKEVECTFSLINENGEEVDESEDVMFAFTLGSVAKLREVADSYVKQQAVSLLAAKDSSIVSSDGPVPTVQSLSLFRRNEAGDEIEITEDCDTFELELEDTVHVKAKWVVV